MQIVAYLLSAWCYLVAFVSILWLVPHACRKYGLGAQVGVLLLAMALVVVGYEAATVADGAEIAEYWLFRKSLIPAATTSIILGEYARYATRRRIVRLKRIRLLGESSNSCACPVQHVAFSGRARRETRETGTEADQGRVIGGGQISQGST